MIKRIAIILIFFINSSTSFAQNVITKEQIAFEYFFESIYPTSYKNIYKLEFSGFTKTEISSFRPFYESCLSEEIAVDLYKAYKENKNKDLIKIDLNRLKKTKVVFRKRKLNYRLNIYKVCEINNLHYVQIEVIRKLHAIDAYFLVINENNEIINWCKTGVII